MKHCATMRQSGVEHLYVAIYAGIDTNHYPLTAIKFKAKYRKQKTEHNYRPCTLTEQNDFNADLKDNEPTDITNDNIVQRI